MRTHFTFPSDPNGDILRRMQAAGDDLNRARPVDYCFMFDTEDAARAFAAEMTQRGSTAVVSPYEGPKSWQVIVTDTMVPQHAAITATEKRLTALAEQRGGSADGWGCIGVD
jgi:hypothetical protein